MSEKTLRTLVGALAVVILIWLVGTLVGRGSGAIAATGPIADVFTGLDSSSVSSIHMAGPKDTVELEREGARWTVNGFPADSGVVARFLAVLPDLKVGDLTATNPANHDRMGVSADSAITVTFDVGGNERTVLVGSSGRRYGTAYVRLPGQDEVYLLDGDLATNARRDLEGWRDRTMVRADSATVTRIEVQADEPYTLVRVDSTWTFEGGGAVQTNAINGLLSELAHMVATGFLAEGDSLAMLPQASETRAYDGDGNLVADVTVGEGTADRWARTAADDYLYRVSSFRAGRIAPKRENVEPGS